MIPPGEGFVVPLEEPGGEMLEVEPEFVVVLVLVELGLVPDGVGEVRRVGLLVVLGELEPEGVVPGFVTTDEVVLLPEVVVHVLPLIPAQPATAAFGAVLAEVVEELLVVVAAGVLERTAGEPLVTVWATADPARDIATAVTMWTGVSLRMEESLSIAGGWIDLPANGYPAT